MKALIPYLFFNGNCREAMNFYQDCFGGELELCTYGDSPENIFEKIDKDKIMHALLKSHSLNLMASDSPEADIKQGNNVQLSIDCASKTETELLFNKLSHEGKVLQPLADTFWNAYFGMLTDKYGVYWMLNCPLTNEKC